MADIVQARVGTVRDIGLHGLSKLDSAVLDSSANRRGTTHSLECVRVLHDSKVCQADLMRVAVDDGRRAIVFRINLLLRHTELKVASVVDLGPLQFLVVSDEGCAIVNRLRERQVLSVGALARHRGTRELDTETALPRCRVVAGMVKPDKVRHPVGVRIARDHNVIGNVVAHESVECSVSVALISVPGIVIQWVDIAVRDGLVDAAEDCLATNHTPGGTASLGRFQGIIEPVFLSAAHHRSAGVVGNGVDIVGVPVQIGDRAIILTSVQHGQVQEIAKLEVSPDPQVVVHLDLTAS